MTILILDDDAFALKLIARQIRACERPGDPPHDLLPFDRAEDALRYLQSTPDTVDLLLCDLQLPGIDGIEVVRRLKGMGFQGRLALVSGEDPRTLASARQLAVSHGLNVVGALTKPVDPAALAHILGTPAAIRRATMPQNPAVPLGELTPALFDDRLVNWYQPKVAVGSGEVLGMEALVRWDHPQLGVLMPAAFLPAAEAGGLMPRVAARVMETALDDVAAWRRCGHDWHVSVNVTMSNLADLSLPDALVRAAASRGVPHDRVTLEVTESQLMSEPAIQLDVLTRLRLKRIRLSIDDFGTGYSGMSQLRDIPVDELKIDRGFVQGACVDEAVRSILGASIRLASDLGIVSVGEGVETGDDLDCLRALGCDVAQGYFIARPMPARLLESWNSAWHRRAPDLFGPN